MDGQGRGHIQKCIEVISACSLAVTGPGTRRVGVRLDITRLSSPLLGGGAASLSLGLEPQLQPHSRHYLVS